MSIRNRALAAYRDWYTQWEAERRETALRRLQVVLGEEPSPDQLHYLTHGLRYQEGDLILFYDYHERRLQGYLAKKSCGRCEGVVQDNLQNLADLGRLYTRAVCQAHTPKPKKSTRSIFPIPWRPPAGTEQPD